jgi:membrane protein implicated in regulation of membrane protease activity
VTRPVSGRGDAGPKDQAGGRAGRERPDAALVLRYTALQVPGWMLLAALLVWIDADWQVSQWVLWVVGLAWIVKDIALFPLTWRAYAGRAVGDLHDPLGRVGISLEPLAPRGRIRVQGETWRALAERESAPISAGTPVRITAREGLELRVRADSEAGAAGSARP